MTPIAIATSLPPFGGGGGIDPVIASAIEAILYRKA